MNIKFIHLLALIALMTVVHFTAVRMGWYEGRVVVDMPLHFLGGILAGMTWFWAMPHLRLGTPSRSLIALGASYRLCFFG